MNTSEDAAFITLAVIKDGIYRMVLRKASAQIIAGI